MLGTARCLEFKEQAGIQKAADNCRKFGIDGLSLSAVTAPSEVPATFPERVFPVLVFPERLIMILPAPSTPSALIRL